jgi:hypothetical protein
MPCHLDLSAQTVRAGCPPNSQHASGSYHAHRDGKRGRVWVRAVIEGGISALGQTAKNSPRAYVFRLAPVIGHCSTRSALHTKNGRLRCHKRPKCREETPKEGSDSGMGLGVATAQHYLRRSRSAAQLNVGRHRASKGIKELYQRLRRSFLKPTTSARGQKTEVAPTANEVSSYPNNGHEKRTSNVMECAEAWVRLRYSPRAEFPAYWYSWVGTTNPALKH